MHAFDGVNDYVTLANPPAIGLSTFTLELWFRRDGAGVTTSTGTGGVTAVPLVSKGRATERQDERERQKQTNERAIQSTGAIRRNAGPSTAFIHCACRIATRAYTKRPERHLQSRECRDRMRAESRGVKMPGPNGPTGGSRNR